MIETLPFDVVLNIANNLSLEELLAVSSLSDTWREATIPSLHNHLRIITKDDLSIPHPPTFPTWLSEHAWYEERCRHVLSRDSNWRQGTPTSTHHVGTGEVSGVHLAGDTLLVGLKSGLIEVYDLPRNQAPILVSSFEVACRNSDGKLWMADQMACLESERILAVSYTPVHFSARRQEKNICDIYSFKGSLILSVEHIETVRAPGEYDIVSVALHKGLYLATGGLNKVYIWDLATGAKLHAFETGSSNISSVHFFVPPSAPGMTVLAIVYGSALIQLRHIEAGFERIGNDIAVARVTHIMDGPWNCKPKGNCVMVLGPSRKSWITRYDVDPRTMNVGYTREAWVNSWRISCCGVPLGKRAIVGINEVAYRWAVYPHFKGPTEDGPKFDDSELYPDLQQSWPPSAPKPAPHLPRHTFYNFLPESIIPETVVVRNLDGDDDRLVVGWHRPELPNTPAATVYNFSP